MSARGLGIAILLVATALVRRAEADEDADERHARAVAAFEEARALIAAGDCASALPKLTESLAAEPSVGAHFSSAECVEGTDPYAAFWHLREAAAVAHRRRDDRGLLADRRADEIARRVGGIRVQMSGGPNALLGFELRIDGRPIDRIYTTGPIALEPGNHAVSVATTDGRRLEQTVHVAEGTVTIFDVALGAVAAPPPPRPPAQSVAPPPPPRGGLGGRQWLAIGLAAAGTLSVAAGTAYGVVTLEKRDELDRACNGDANACTGAPRVVDPVLESAERNATASTVLFAVGAGLLAGAAVLFFVAPGRASARASRPLLAGVSW